MVPHGQWSTSCGLSGFKNTQNISKEPTANFTADYLIAPPTPCMEISLRKGTKPHRQLSISCVLGCFKNKSNESNVDVQLHMQYSHIHLV